jgi:hypothetical protein
MNQSVPLAVNEIMTSFFPRRTIAMACCTALLAAFGSAFGADPGLLELDRMQLERAQRSDELRLRLEQDQRSLQLQQDEAQRRFQLQPSTPQTTLQVPSSDAVERKLQLDQQQAQDRLSQQLLHQQQSVRDMQLRQSLMFEPDATAQGRLAIERQRFMREREAQLRQFGANKR